MDKAQATQKFWESFGLPAYDENTVPDGAALPYITYQVKTASIDEPVYPSASIWYKSRSWEAISKKADEIAEAIRQMPTIKIDGGRMFVTTGAPFAQRMSDEDDSIRRILLQVNIEFLTN